MSHKFFINSPALNAPITNQTECVLQYCITADVRFEAITWSGIDDLEK
jgi:hypothetical protein